MKWLIAANLFVLMLIGFVAFHVQTETETIITPTYHFAPPPPTEMQKQ